MRRNILNALRPLLLLLFVSPTTPLIAQTSSITDLHGGPCESLALNTDHKFRYLLCSDGLYDRESKSALIRFHANSVEFASEKELPADIRSDYSPIPDRYSFSYLTADGSKALRWRDRTGDLFYIYSNGSADAIVHIVSPQLIDQNGSTIRTTIGEKECPWEEGTQICALDYLRSAMGGDGSYALVDKGKIDAFVLTVATKSLPKEQPRPLSLVATGSPTATAEPMKFWPLGPNVVIDESPLEKIAAKIDGVASKHDLLGLIPGMDYQNALAALANKVDIQRPDRRCEVFAFDAEAIRTFAKRGQRQSCDLQEGRLDVIFTEHLQTNRVRDIELSFNSGATPAEMAAMQ